MKTITDNGICLFCMKKAGESWSSHGRSFDGYSCDCNGQREFRRLRATVESNQSKLDAVQKEVDRKAEVKALRKRLKELNQ